MTPEQEAQVFTDLGKIQANIERYHDDTKKTLNLITGNGRPQDGILSIMTDVRKGVEGLNVWVRDHGLVHTAMNNCFTEQDKRLTTLETGRAVSEAVGEVKEEVKIKKTLKDILCDTLANPVVERAIIIIVTGIIFTIAGWFGFSPKHGDRHVVAPITQETPR